MNLGNIYAGVGFAQWAWKEAQLRTYQVHGFAAPFSRDWTQNRSGSATAEYYRIIDAAERKVVEAVYAATLARPARAWSWPEYVSTVPELLQLTSEGFDLVTKFVGRNGDTPVFALMRDGELSPPKVLKQRIAHRACLTHFSHFMRLPDGKLLYKRKAAA